MIKSVGILVSSCVFLVATLVFADTDKTSSGKEGVKCMYGGEAECGIAWEGRGLFNIEASAHYAFMPIWDEDLDLQQAYLCCSSDKNRKNVCSTNLVTTDHCRAYVTSFFNPAETSWGSWARQLSETSRSPNSAAADAMASCRKSSDDSWKQWSDYIVAQLSQAFDVLALVDLPFAAGTLFWEKATAKEALVAFGSAEKKYLLEDVTEFTQQDIRDEIATNLAEWDRAHTAFFDSASEQDIEYFTTASPNYVGDEKPPLDLVDVDRAWGDANEVGVENLTSSWVGEIGPEEELSYKFHALTQDLGKIAEEKGDPKMLLPETRKAINEIVLSRWNWLMEDEAEELKYGNELYSRIEEKYGKNIAEQIVPFKDVTTDYTATEKSAEALRARFGRIAEVRSAGAGADGFSKNTHAIKMGYWDLVKEDRLSSDAVSKADKLKEAIHPQIDDDFVGHVYDRDGRNNLTPSQLWSSISAERMKRVDKEAYSALIDRLKTDAFLGGWGLGGTAYMTYNTQEESEGCIYAIFDTLRDNTECLWNTTEGNLCDN